VVARRIAASVRAGKSPEYPDPNVIMPSGAALLTLVVH
jgi:hypothetical protein